MSVSVDRGRRNGLGAASCVRVFVSFDLDHDQDLFDRLADQAERDAPFAIAGRSEGGALGERWDARVRARILASDQILVLCGEHTADSERVSAELVIAAELGKPHLLLWGRRERMCVKPRGTRSDDGMYSWTKEVLEEQLTATLRRHTAPDIPESMKRQAPAAKVAKPD